MRAAARMTWQYTNTLEKTPAGASYFAYREFNVSAIQSAM